MYVNSKYNSIFFRVRVVKDRPWAIFFKNGLLTIVITRRLLENKKDTKIINKKRKRVFKNDNEVVAEENAKKDIHRNTEKGNVNKVIKNNMKKKQLLLNSPKTI